MITLKRHPLPLKLFFMPIMWLLSTPLFATMPGWYFQAKDVTALHHSTPTAKLYYGKAPEEFGFLRVPNQPGPHPIVMIIHGGCWLSTIATVQNTEALADALSQKGYATWNIEYRQTDQPGGGYPGTFLDVAQAADFLKQIASQYSLDLTHLLIIGHSAGGQLALWLSARSKLPKHSSLYQPNPLPIQGVISLGGVTDLKIARQQAEKVCGADVIGKLVGASIKIPFSTHLAETSPQAMLPVTVPQVLIYGRQDQVVPEKMGQLYVAAAKAKGQTVTLDTVNDAAHHEYTVPNSVVWPLLLQTIHTLFIPTTPIS